MQGFSVGEYLHIITLNKHMEYLSEEAIERIEKELSYRIIELYDLNTECLLYDITNFYTFIQEHEGNKLPKTYIRLR